MLRKLTTPNLFKNIVPSLGKSFSSDDSAPKSGSFVLDWQKYQDQTRRVGRKENDPENTTFIFFPGQGSQYVGMTKHLQKYNAVKDMFRIANEVLG